MNGVKKFVKVSVQVVQNEQQGPVAQWLEQGTHNPLVQGSSPCGPKPYHLWCFDRPIRRAAPRGFTLVEVSLALGLAGFALIAVLGALPTGLRAVREAQSQEIAANVAQRLQASLQPISFAAATTDAVTTIDTLAASTHFYTEDGTETADPASASPASPPAFYKVTFAVGAAVFNDGTSDATGSAAAQSANARNVTVTLCYPQIGIVQGSRSFVYSFLLARQGTN